MLINIYRESLPEDWRGERFPSFRRLLVILRHLGPDSPIARLEGTAWSTEAELLDLIRRDQIALTAASAKKKVPYPKAHPASPEGRATAEQDRRARERRANRRADAQARDAARRARLAARRDAASNTTEGGTP